MATSMLSKLLCEFVGTFLLVFTIGCNVLSKSAPWHGVSIACVVMVLIYSFGGISGANFNPAVSFSLGVSKCMQWKDVGIYSIIQIAAGILAGLSYFILFGDAFVLGPTKNFDIVHAGICEILYTFMLCFVVLNTAAVDSKQNQYYGLAIGFVIVAGAYGAGKVSGGCFNPAVAFAIDVSSAHLSFGWCFSYAGFELIGALLAAVLFKVVRPIEGMSPTLVSKLASEFLGTYMLVLTVGLNVLGDSPCGAFSIAASLMCMIYALGDVSGANFNPAVTLAIYASRLLPDFPTTQAVLYVIVQLVAGIAAAFTYSGVYAWKSFHLGPKEHHTWMQVGIAEAVFTFVLCLVVLCVAVSPKTASSNMFGFAIGSCVTVGGFAIGNVSGGSLNPAVSFGINATELLSGGRFFNALIYSAFELCGAIVAALVVRLTHGSDFKDEECIA